MKINKYIINKFKFMFGSLLKTLGLISTISCSHSIVKCMFIKFNMYTCNQKWPARHSAAANKILWKTKQASVNDYRKFINTYLSDSEVVRKKI